LITATVKQALPTKPGSHGLVDLFFSIAQAFFFCSTLSEFENFLLCGRILINVTTNVKTKRQANFKDVK
jgi:hypothetical protein